MANGRVVRALESIGKEYGGWETVVRNHVVPPAAYVCVTWINDCLYDVLKTHYDYEILKLSRDF